MLTFVLLWSLESHMQSHICCQFLRLSLSYLVPHQHPFSKTNVEVCDGKNIKQYVSNNMSISVTWQKPYIFWERYLSVTIIRLMLSLAWMRMQNVCFEEKKAHLQILYFIRGCPRPSILGNPWSRYFFPPGGLLKYDLGRDVLLRLEK